MELSQAERALQGVNPGSRESERRNQRVRDLRAERSTAERELEARLEAQRSMVRAYAQTEERVARAYLDWEHYRAQEMAAMLEALARWQTRLVQGIVRRSDAWQAACHSVDIGADLSVRLRRFISIPYLPRVMFYRTIYLSPIPIVFAF